MKNKILKFVSLVMMGVMMLGNSVAFAVLEEVAIVGAVSWGVDYYGEIVGCSTNVVQEDCWYVEDNSLDLNKFGPSKVQDEDYENTWWNAGAYVSAGPYIVIDLGSEKTFSQLKVLPGSSPTGVISWEYEVSNDNSTFVELKDLEEDNYEGTANTSSFPDWGITNLDESVSYRYIKIKPINWNGSWVSIHEIEVWNVVFQGPEFSTYIYLATLAFTFAIGYRKIPELMREKN